MFLQARGMCEDASREQDGDPMAGGVETGAYKDVVLFLATAGVVVPLFRRWKVSPILGFLFAGVVLGPYGLGSLAHELNGWDFLPSRTHWSWRNWRNLVSSSCCSPSDLSYPGSACAACGDMCSAWGPCR